MKITVRRNKRSRSMSISFKAGKGNEGVELKEVVMNIAKDSPGDIQPVKMIEELGRLGYRGEAKKTPRGLEVDLKRG